MNTSTRLLSLDIFRGLTIAFMILVNNPGDWANVYSPLLHADWHGCTPTDWVFPFFLFIVGVSIALAIAKRKSRGDDKSAIIKKILWRTLIIFAIGVFLNGFPYYEFPLRIAGVLPRIAIVYGITALIFLYADWKRVIWVTVACLVAYWLMMAFIPVPIDEVMQQALDTGKVMTAHGLFDLKPLHQISDNFVAGNYQRGVNLEAYLDRHLLPGRLYQKTWDPEGLLSMIPSVGTCLLGVLTGLWIRRDMDVYKKLTGILGMGAILVAAGFVWSLTFPINKNLWTSSYVLYVSGVSLLFLGVIYWLVDVLGYKKGTKPFIVFGMNALIIYALSGLIARLFGIIKWTTATGETISLKGWLYNTFFTSFLSDINASFGWALFNVLLLLGIGWILYWRKIFIKV
ncbi:MAG: putative acyltransferase [Saprospiraceae bacterium]|jgi:predicted acyltransferase